MDKTVFFDLDGTLTDSAPGIMNSVSYALEKMGHASLPEKELRRFIGPPLPTEFRAAFLWSAEECSRAVGFFREYFASKGMWENRPYPGVKEMLSDLRSAGISLQVATSKPLPFARQILDRFGLLPFFDRVYGASLDETQSAEKDVILQKALSSFPPAGRCVMVGDRKYDVSGGKKNGLFTVAVLYGYGSRRELTAARPDALVKSVSECRNLLLSL